MPDMANAVEKARVRFLWSQTQGCICGLHRRMEKDLLDPFPLRRL